MMSLSSQSAFSRAVMRWEEVVIKEERVSCRVEVALSVVVLWSVCVDVCGFNVLNI